MPVSLYIFCYVSNVVNTLVSLLVFAVKVVQIRAALVPVPSPDKWGGLQQEEHLA